VLLCPRLDDEDALAVFRPAVADCLRQADSECGGVAVKLVPETHRQWAADSHDLLRRPLFICLSPDRVPFVSDVDAHVIFSLAMNNPVQLTVVCGEHNNPADPKAPLPASPRPALETRLGSPAGIAFLQEQLLVAESACSALRVIRRPQQPKKAAAHAVRLPSLPDGLAGALRPFALCVLDQAARRIAVSSRDVHCVAILSFNRSLDALSLLATVELPLLRQPVGLACDASGQGGLVVACYGAEDDASTAGLAHICTLTWRVTRLQSGDGPAPFPGRPFGVGWRRGSLVVSDFAAHTVVTVQLAGDLSIAGSERLTGSGVCRSTGGPLSLADVACPAGLLVDAESTWLCCAGGNDSGALMLLGPGAPLATL
jgi:hypothetical protein